jgi:ABC-2 type transport system permease protein
MGVRLDTGQWLRMTGLILVGLIPFGALAILFGHLLTADAIGPAMGGLVAVLAVLGGVWFPLTNGVLYHIGRALPSYWLVQASHVALGGGGWGTTGWLVMAAWSVVLGALAARAYRRDTGRV